MINATLYLQRFISFFFFTLLPALTVSKACKIFIFCVMYLNYLNAHPFNDQSTNLSSKRLNTICTLMP